MFKAVLKDRERKPSDEIEEAITKVGNDLTFDFVHSVFQKSMSHLA
jgi:hypothetical protein